MKSIYSLLFVLLFTLVESHAQLNTTSSFKINSKYLNEERHCLVQLPEFYNQSENDDSYPLIILLDGATFFETTGGIVSFMSSQKNGNYFMPESIIVAIENVDRRRDFTVTKIVTQRGNTSGGGRSFLNFIEKELIPYIDQHYRTESHRTLIGHSLGGLLVLNSFMDPESIFDAFVSIDPSIWWDEPQMQNKVNITTAISFTKKLYVATANQGEEKFERNKKRHDRLYELFVAKAGQNDFIALHYFENEDHRSVPLRAIYEGLKFVNQDE